MVCTACVAMCAPCKQPLPFAMGAILGSAGNVLHSFITAWNGSHGKWQGLLTRSIVAPAVLTHIPPLAMLHLLTDLYVAVTVQIGSDEKWEEPLT